MLHQHRPVSVRHHRRRRTAVPAGLLGAGAILLAACSSSSPSNSAARAATASNSGGDTAAYTVKVADVAGVGSVLVNGAGHTLYILSSEAGGKLTCTDGNGCTAVWPDTELPSGVTTGIAGSGAQSSMLSTVRSSDGKLYLTYAGYPLYTYVGDTGAGTAKGLGITSFGGTWYPISPSGALVTKAGASSSSTQPASGGTSNNGGGYGY